MVKDLRDYIANKEMDMFERYIDTYAAIGEGQRTVSGWKLLECWADGKKDLFQLLGNKLSVSKQINFNTSSEIIIRDIQHLINSHPFATSFCTRVINVAWDNYIKNLPRRATHNEVSDAVIDTRHLYDALTILFSSHTLQNNVYNGAEFEVTNIATGKNIKIPAGCKAMKAIGKIATAFNLDMDDFEDFRIKVSQCLNQKKLEGTLTLSIHPLDYLTMSDNDSGWSSCMSWRDTGCYRQGTVEMMNSPMVLVAFLESSSPMQLLDKDDLWNNKKWRELIVVNSDLITNIKSYPYHNDNLTTSALEWIRELAEQNGPHPIFDFGDTRYSYSYGECFPFSEESDVSICVCAETGYMYNDFENNSYHNMCYLSNRLTPEGDYIYINFNYSGLSECMACGNTDIDMDEEDAKQLMCDDCDPRYYCDYCGDTYFNADDLINVDDEYLCPYCLENETDVDSFTCEVHLKRNLAELRVVNDVGETQKTFKVFTGWNYTFDTDVLKDSFTENGLALLTRDNIHFSGWAGMPYINIPVSEYIDEN